MPSGRAWGSVCAELRCFWFILSSPHCILPKIAILAGFAYLFGPWDLIPNRIPIFGHFDELGFIAAGLILARLMVHPGPRGDRLAWEVAGHGSGAALAPAILALQSDAMSGWLINRRRISRLGRHLNATHRLGGQLRRAIRADGAADALFGLLGYRLWWILRAPLARRRSALRNLVVIGGSPRSGTTLLRSILGRHPAIFAGAESTVFLHRVSAPEDIAERLDLHAEEVELWQRQSRSQMEFIERCAAGVLLRSGKRFWAEKTPHNVKRFGFVRRRFPHARLVHVVRDGRDVVCSLRRKPFAKLDGAACDSEAAARRCAVQWRTSVKAGLRFRGRPNYHEVRYEALVANPEPVLRALLEFLGLPWDDALLQADAHPVRPDPYEPRASGQIFDSAIGRWRHELSPAHRDAVRVLTGPLLARLGYEEE
jgi:hypothetical protein